MTKEQVQAYQTNLTQAIDQLIHSKNQTQTPTSFFSLPTKLVVGIVSVLVGLVFITLQVKKSKRSRLKRIASL